MPSVPACALQIVAAAALCACAAPVGGGLDSPDPQSRTIALAHIAEAPRESDIPALIAALLSADPAQRLLAIRTLERMTGQTLGYRHYDPEWVRRDAVVRWRQWWVERGGAGEPALGSAPS